MYDILHYKICVHTAGATKTVAKKGDGDSQVQHLRSETTRTNYSHEKIQAQIVEPGKTLLLTKQLNTSIMVDEFEKGYANADMRLQVVNFDGSE